MLLFSVLCDVIDYMIVVDVDVFMWCVVVYGVVCNCCAPTLCVIVVVCDVVVDYTDDYMCCCALCVH